jgi:hypothetical protein
MPTKEEYFGKGLTLYGQNKHEEEPSGEFRAPARNPRQRFSHGTPRLCHARRHRSLPPAVRRQAWGWLWSG